MPLDPRIALGVQTPQMRSPLQSIGAIAQLREGEEQTEQRRILNEQRRRAVEDDDAIRSTLQEHGSPDKAIEVLYKQGRAGAAGMLAKQVFEDRKSRSEQEKSELANTGTKLEYAGRIARTMTDEASFQTGRKAIGALLGPEYASALGETYDPETVRRGALWGTDTKTQLEFQQKGIENFQKSYELMLKAAREGILNEKDKGDIEKNYLLGASNLLSTTKSQAEWDTMQRLAVERGAPAPILALFGNQWSPAAVERAKKLGLTAKEEEDVVNQKAQRDMQRTGLGIQQQNANTATAREAREARESAAGGGGTGRALTPNRKSEIEQRKHRAYAELEEELRKNTSFYSDTGKFSIPDDAKGEVAKRKVRIEDAARAEYGQPPLLEAERALAGDPAKTGELQRVRKAIRELTGEKETPLEKMQSLAREVKATSDPAKKKALQAQLSALLEQYGS